MAGTSKPMLNNSGNSGHPHLVPDLTANAFSLSLLRMMLALGLSDTAFIMLNKFSLYRSMEPDRKPRNRPTHLWTINLQQKMQEYI